MTFLLLNQTFYPDVMATGQYLTEVAVRVVERGREVAVVTTRRGYDQPETRFQKRETFRDIRITVLVPQVSAKAPREDGPRTLLVSWHLALKPRHGFVVTA